MARIFPIRFQHWISISTVLLVVVLTAAFLMAVYGKFQSLVREAAETKSSFGARQIAIQIEHLIADSKRLASTLSSARAEHYVRADRHMDTQSMLPQMKGALRWHPDVYSIYFGLSRDEFLQAIGVREDPRVLAALGAPVTTQVAIRTIVRTSGRGGSEERTEHWEFLDAHDRRLAERSQPARYAPTQRPWYTSASQVGGLSVTQPYAFASTGEPGVTVATPLTDRLGVFGVDLTLKALGSYLSQLALSPNGAAVVADGQGRVLAFHGRGNGWRGVDVPLLGPMDRHPNPVLSGLAAVAASLATGQVAVMEIAKTEMVFARQNISIEGGQPLQVFTVAPISDFTEVVTAARRDVFVMAAVILMVLVPLALAGTRKVTRSLVSLAGTSERLKRLDFSVKPPHVESFLYEVNTLGQAQEVMHESIRRRTEELERAQTKLASLVDIGIMLGREQNRDDLLRHALFSARDIAHCEAATLFLKTDENALRLALRTNDEVLPVTEFPLFDPVTKAPVHHFVCTHVALTGETVVVDDVYADDHLDLSGTKRFSEESGLRVVSLLTVPVKSRNGKVIGVLQLMNALDSSNGAVIPFNQDTVGFVEALVGQAGVAIENVNLLDAQKALVDGMIRIIAGAIDAKSPYTGGHCERVPELAMMLAQKACEVKEGPLADFEFKNDDEWREFRAGAWLHDCGKVTTPEYVVDKATKLETIYNRIHEIRTRFEVLLRDAQIARLEAIYEQGARAEDADARYAERHAQLVDDFAFVAECNLGGEFMAPERIERLQQIAQNSWWRHFNERLGLSHAESARYGREPEDALPVLEPLLSDKPHHVVAREPGQLPDPRYGFKVQVPPHLYNHGEMHNLRVGRGTLSEEERFKINEHIIQTIVMLERLPFPDHLKRVPEYAGTHHETLKGSGYPRMLTERELSVPARIMAIADIFEALTACDRPYKKTKTLSESVRILHQFKQEGHIDGVLFDLFLTSGAYREYAERFLLAEQIDEVDIRPFLSVAEPGVASAGS